MRGTGALIALLTLATAVRLPAQQTEAAVAGQVEADVAQLIAGPTLAAWQRAHPAEKVELAHWDISSDPYKTEFQRDNLWCAASVSGADGRTGLFYTPLVKRSALPPLPAKPDPTITRTCHLHAMWHQIRPFSSIEALTGPLSMAWGPPNSSSPRPILQGSGLWVNVVSWQRQGVTIWVAIDPGCDGSGKCAPRLIALATRDDEPVTTMPGSLLIDEKVGTEVTKAAANMAGQDAALTMAMLSRSICANGPLAAEAGTVSVSRLTRWLQKGRALPFEQQAASLLVADAYVSCLFLTDDVLRAAIALGAQFPELCGEAGYSHNFRKQAEKLAPNSRVAEMAIVASFTQPCSIGDENSAWSDLVVKYGDGILERFPTGQWTPWIHLAVARAHAATLELAYPNGNPETEKSLPLTPGAMQRERAEAISHFRQAIAEAPDSAESVFAWHEAWRLLAGLPPDYFPFGCGCE